MIHRRSMDATRHDTTRNEIKTIYHGRHKTTQNIVINNTHTRID